MWMWRFVRVAFCVTAGLLAASCIDRTKIDLDSPDPMPPFGIGGRASSHYKQEHVRSVDHAGRKRHHDTLKSCESDAATCVGRGKADDPVDNRAPPGGAVTAAGPCKGDLSCDIPNAANSWAFHVSQRQDKPGAVQVEGTSAASTGKFHWPLPQPSFWMDVTDRNIVGLPTTFGSAKAFDDALRTKLWDAGYKWLGYYPFTRGYAVVTPAESISSDGTPLGNNRFDTDCLNNRSETIGAGLLTYWKNKRGYSRIIVFAITDEIEVPEAGASLEWADAQKWPSGGSRVLDGLHEGVKAEVLSPAQLHLLVAIYSYLCVDRGRGAEYEFSSLGGEGYAALQKTGLIK